MYFDTDAQTGEILPRFLQKTALQAAKSVL